MIEKEQPKRSYFDEYDNLTFHPYNILLVLVIFGISALFLALTISQVYTRIQANLPPVKPPMIFLASTLVLLCSSLALSRARRCYREDKTSQYQLSLQMVLWLSLLFLVLQGIGWYEMIGNNLFFNKNNAVSYLYLISIVHFAHILIGIPFLILFIRTARLRMKEPVSVLVYFSDPSKNLRLRLLSIYWHFLDGLWIYLVLFFWINYFIG